MHVCEGTVRKRLEEFKTTKTAQLTYEQFNKPGIEAQAADEEEMDPPAFCKNKAVSELEIEADKEQEVVHQLMEDKAKLIEEKLDKADKPVLGLIEDDEEEEEDKEDEEEEEKTESNENEEENNDEEIEDIDN